MDLELGSSAANNIGKEITTRLRESTSGNAKKLTRFEHEDLEKRIAFEYAREKGYWIDDLYSLGAPLSGGGNENTLALDTNKGDLYKSNNLNNSNNSIYELLQQISNHNLLFPETKYELVGFTGVAPSASGRVPYVEPIFRQAYIPNATQASEEEIREFMESNGFKQRSSSETSVFTNEKYTVADLRPRNVLKSTDGNIAVIDDIVTKNSDKHPK
ncbi:MAG: hypothetical protein LBQ31_03515 [Bacteroidales bacterium]|nr:hypothetical protein [Bacteroidales bacterium]